MLDRDKLQELVQDIVPECYRPPLPSSEERKKDAPWPHLTDVHYAKNETIDSLLKRYLPDSNHDGIQAILVNWGILSRDAGATGWEERMNSRTIMIRENIDISVLGLSFIILHEIGHIHWENAPAERLKWRVDNEELFADMYAHDRLEELYGIDVAMKIILQYGSAQGFHSFVQQGKECQM